MGIIELAVIGFLIYIAIAYIFKKIKNRNNRYTMKVTKPKYDNGLKIGAVWGQGNSSGSSRESPKQICSRKGHDWGQGTDGPSRTRGYTSSVMKICKRGELKQTSLKSHRISGMTI